MVFRPGEIRRPCEAMPKSIEADREIAGFATTW